MTAITKTTSVSPLIPSFPPHLCRSCICQYRLQREDEDGDDEDEEINLGQVLGGRGGGRADAVKRGSGNGGGGRQNKKMMWQGGYSTPPYLICDVLDVSGEGEGEDLEASLDAEDDGEADLGPVESLRYTWCERASCGHQAPASPVCQLPCMAGAPSPFPFPSALHRHPPCPSRPPQGSSHPPSPWRRS